VPDTEQRASGWLLPAAVLLLVTLWFPSEGLSARTAGRDAIFDQGTCALCHIRDSIFIDSSYLSTAMREVFSEERVCMSCHNGSVLDHRKSLWRGEQHPDILEGGNRERVCSPCHSPHETGGWEVLRHTSVRLSGGGDPLCTGCHPRYGSRSDGLHGAGFPNAGCGACHRAHGGFGKALLRGPKDSVCLRCHDADRKNRPGGHPATTRKQGTNPPEAFPGCTACHPVHRGTVGKDVAESRCTACHEPETGISTPGASGHRPGVACLSCHSFHARSGEGGKGLQSSDMNPSVLCGKCHGEVVAKTPEEGKRRGTHPVETDRTKNPLCFRCHRIHKAAPGTPLLASDKAYFCLDCHEEQNTIREVRGILLAHPIFERVAEGRLAEAAKRHRLVLGPAGEIVCGTCHSVHRSVPGTSLLGKGFEKAGNCFICHDGLRGERHIPSADRERDPGCSLCHKVHGMRTGMDDPWKEVCTSCHPGETGHLPGRGDRSISRPRELPGFDERGRAVEIGGGISCPTCHEPHGTSEVRKKLRRSYRSSGFLCTACHRDKESVALTPHDLRGIAGNGICEPCHLPHGGSSPWMWGMNRGEGDPSEESCRSCHREKGMGFPVPGAGHPSGMVIVRPLPDRYPIYGEDWIASRKGVLGCTTCHQVHGDALGFRSGERNALLRNVPPEDGKQGEYGPFCRSCHPGQRLSHGAATCTGCHPPHAGKTEEGGCTSCHSSLARGGASLHLERGTACKDCHRVHGEGGKEALVSRCTGCHPRTGRIRGSSHAAIGEMTCEPCHPSHRTPDNTMVRRNFYDEPFGPDQSCLRCHDEERIGTSLRWMEHPKARREVPTNYGATVVLESPIHMNGRLREGDRPLFPLFDAGGKPALSGRMGCGTCHDPHLGAVGNSGARKRSSAFYLRDPSGIFLSELCTPCHGNKYGKQMVCFYTLPGKPE